jgi:hypothetical protein
MVDTLDVIDTALVGLTETPDDAGGAVGQNDAGACGVICEI